MISGQNRLISLFQCGFISPIRVTTNILFIIVDFQPHYQIIVDFQPHIITLCWVSDIIGVWQLRNGKRYVQRGLITPQ